MENTRANVYTQIPLPRLMAMLDKMALIFVLAFSYVQMSSTTGTSVTLTREPSEAFPGMSLQFKCDVTTANRTRQGLFFERNSVSMCTVTVDDCTQYTSDTTSHTRYTCGCGQHTGGNYVYILNASSLHHDVVGEWRCQYDYSFSNTISVDMADPMGPTQIRLDKTEIQTKEGDSVNMTCSANCLPDCRYSWIKSGQDLTSQTKGSRGQVLALNGVVSDDSGNYTCTAVNPSSNNARSISMNVHVLTGPKRKLEAAFTPTLKAMTGQTARLEVTMSGDPRPDVSWCKIREGALTPVNNGAVDTVRQDTPETESGSVTTVLELKVETVDDLGMYCVSAENIVDRTIVYIDLQGEDVGDENGGYHTLSTEQGLLKFGAGVGVGAAAMLLVIIVVAVIFCRKYKQLKRALDSPYASTERMANAVTDSNLYQELPPPKTSKKQPLEDGYTLPSGGTVCSAKVDMINPISKTNPIYDLVCDDNIGSK